MKVIVFGAGNFYRERKEKLNSFDDIEIVAFADNNSSLWGTEIDGNPVVPPDQIQTFEYDNVLIMSIYIYAIYEQLINLEVDKDRVITWERFFAESMKGKREIYSLTPLTEKPEKSVLIISTDLGYNGGTLAAVYAALALKQRGVSVVVAAPKGDNKLIEEMIGYKIDVVIWLSLPYIFDIDKKWIQQFEIVIVNTLQMLECIHQIVKIRPTMWWVHEPLELYAPVMMKFPDCKNKVLSEALNIYAVSRIAQRNFNNEMADIVNRILTIGIPDTGTVVRHKKQNDRKMIFAIIGVLLCVKAQDIFINAASKIDSGKAEFWIIGPPNDTEYCQRILEMAEGIGSVKFLGKLTRNEMNTAFQNIDVVVCASHEETLSMTIIEGMMHRKICITTENTGIAEYMEDGINGFIIPPNDVSALAERMSWLVENRDKTEELRTAARSTYEKYFTMEVLGENLKRALNETAVKWRET